MENLYLVVGLGNPGAQYEQTRHNVGFMVTEAVAARLRAVWSFEKKFNARFARCELDSRRLLLGQPQTFMNSSGEAVRAISSFYDIKPERVLVVVDDADLPLGHLRMRPGGSAGGHHGLESIEQHLSTREYPRLRIGIGRKDGAREIVGHVLGKFGSTERMLVDKVVAVAADQAMAWVSVGIQKAMNQFNGDHTGGVDESDEK